MLPPSPCTFSSHPAGCRPPFHGSALGTLHPFQPQPHPTPSSLDRSSTAAISASLSQCVARCTQSIDRPAAINQSSVPPVPTRSIYICMHACSAHSYCLAALLFAWIPVPSHRCLRHCDHWPRSGWDGCWVHVLYMYLRLTLEPRLTRPLGTGTGFKLACGCVCLVCLVSWAHCGLSQ